ncbi:MAG: FmdB family zinc ribbon protein [Balneolaceae bacterium]
MPTYEYKREDGTVFEVMQSINEDALKSCPETGQAVKRIISGGSGVVLKGTGWYVTDYKNNGTKNGSLKAESDDKPAEKKTEPKDSKTTKSDTGD